MATRLAAGTKVEVRTGFDRSWAEGFEVVSSSFEGYHVRRLSDGMELPVAFPDDEVRRARQRNDLWWV
ncbi:MAG TPA: hypothetical protein VMN58_07740 [Acidimicrobiales bacterium]|nr:hypothetical protein [Acidimicrobiales bacterium]